MIMPCVHQAQTIGTCIRKARASIEREGVRGAGPGLLRAAPTGRGRSSAGMARRRRRYALIGGHGAGRGGTEGSSRKDVVMGVMPTTDTTD